MKRRRTLSTRLAAAALLCVCLVQAFGLGLDTLRAYLPSPAAAAAIEISHEDGITLETCPHHPEGCPKSCLCPKTMIHLHAKSGAKSLTPATAPSSKPASTSGVLVETAWVTCNAEGSAESGPVFSVFVAEPAFELAAFTAFQSVQADHAEATLEAEQAPPVKIPIA